ncbi:MAG TPA: type II toxin-antitoxin system HicA family toxin [Thermoanaerobaculia bacterium]
MDRRRLLERLRKGHVQNVDFAAFCDLLEGLGFHCVRIKGSHHHFRRPGLPEKMTVQPDRGKAKPYQIRQLLGLIEDYNLRLEGRS